MELSCSNDDLYCEADEAVCTCSLHMVHDVLGMDCKMHTSITHTRFGTLQEMVATIRCDYLLAASSKHIILHWTVADTGGSSMAA